MGKCPKCDKLIGFVNITQIDVNSGRNKWNGISYNCPFCFSILSVGIDPIAIKTDTLSGVESWAIKLTEMLRLVSVQINNLEHRIKR